VNFVHRHLATVLYVVVVAAAFGFVLHGQSQQGKQTVATCLRGNVIRAQLNYTGSVLRSFISEAASARDQQAALDRVKGDAHSAKINADAAEAYRALLSGFTAIALVDCQNL
jgi:glycine betaine/choline ABC-type transport system substrate-binding protein